jgi:hypothetical protein
MFIRRDVKLLKAHVSSILFLFSAVLLVSTNLLAQISIRENLTVSLDGKVVDYLNFSNCNKSTLENKVDSVFVACIAEQLMVHNMYNNFKAIDIKWINNNSTDTLLFYSTKVKNEVKFDQLYLKGIPQNWYPKIPIDKTDNHKFRNQIYWINNRLQTYEFGEIEYAIYRNSKDNSFTFKWFLKNKNLSYVDFIAGFGNVNNESVGVFGQGKMELNHILSPFSKTIFQFERLSQRNTSLSLDHSQLTNISIFGPNNLRLHLSQRDSLFRRNEIEVGWDFVQFNSLIYSINLFYLAASISDNTSSFSNTNSGSHQNRGIGLSISLNERNFLKWQKNNSYGFRINFDQLFKNYIPNDANSVELRNVYLSRINLMANSSIFVVNNKMTFNAKIHIYTIPTKTNFSAAEVLTTGGLNSIRAYYENQFLAKDAIMLNLENRLKFDESSYFFVFADAARLNINQQIVGSTATNWNNTGEWQSLLSTGFGIRIFGNQIQTQAIAAFSSETGLLNPRIHIGIVRLF